MPKLQNKSLNILNVGLKSFADNIRAAGGLVKHVDWQPPAGGDGSIGSKLADLINNERIEKANKKAFGYYVNANPVLEGIGIARDDLPGMTEKLLLHAGPPLDWENMCGPMKGAILGAAIYEGWASNLSEAERADCPTKFTLTNQNTSPKSR